MIGEVRLAPGVYNYEFGCKLPPDLPTSFEGKFGYIRYTALVVIDNKRLPEKTFSESFTVIREVDLNYNRELRVNYHIHIVCGPLKVQF